MSSHIIIGTVLALSLGSLWALAVAVAVGALQDVLATFGISLSLHGFHAAPDTTTDDAPPILEAARLNEDGSLSLYPRDPARPVNAVRPWAPKTPDYGRIVKDAARKLHATIYSLHADDMARAGVPPWYWISDEAAEDPRASFSLVDSRQLFTCLPVRTELGCLIAMHELGHIATTPPDSPPNMVDDEARATQWAIDHLPFTISPDSAREAITALDHYASATGPATEEAAKKTLAYLHKIADTAPARHWTTPDTNGAFPSDPVPDLPEDRPEWQEAYREHLARVAALWDDSRPMADAAEGWSTPFGWTPPAVPHVDPDKVVKKIGAGEPITTLHQRTNLDSGLTVAILVEIARSSELLMIPISGLYLCVWIVCTIRAKV